jgi:hypothetical protein
MNDTFKFLIDADIDLEKSSTEGKRLIQGYASTPEVDRQGESLVQKGLDISDFVNHGFLNYDHDSSKILGYPTSGTHIDAKGLWVEGELMKGVPLADEIWNVAVALKKSNAPRRLGFSVEGKVMARKGSQITKAKIYNCAITPNPVNVNATWEAIVKSFAGKLDKALEAGYGTSPDTQANGGAFREEELERAIKVLSYNLTNPEFWVQVNSHLKANGDTYPTKGAAVVYLQLSKGLSRTDALNIIKKIS